MRQPTSGGDPDAAVKAAHAALYRAGEARAYGGGLLVTGGRVLTCAHVVNQALGRPPFERRPPAERDGAVDGLLVALPGTAPDGRFRAVVERWLPGCRSGSTEPAQQGDPEWSDDLALLRLVEPPPPLPTGPPGAPLGHHRTGGQAFAWYGSGNPSTVAAAVVQGSTERWLVLDTPGSAQELVEGYSGTPLWDRDQQRVVGLVVSRRGRRAFAVPTTAIVDHFPWLAPTAGTPDLRTTGTGLHLPQAAPGWQQLLDPVRRILSDSVERSSCAWELAADLGADRPLEPVAPEWFVLTALSAPHGVATLMAMLADRAPTREERISLQVQAVYTAPDELLTAVEHRDLLDLLATLPQPPAGGTPMARPRLVAARALPLGPALDDVDWPELVRTLEGYRPRFGKLPSLLRVVEFAAQETADDVAGPALRAWNDAVAKRLDLASALAEHRTRAAEAVRTSRAREDGEQPVVQVQLWRSGATDSFGCTVRVRGPGGFVLHRSIHDDPLNRTALLELLAEVLARVAREGEPGTLPKLEFFVQKDELDLDVDQWVYRPDELFPSVLGQDFLVVLRCPELRRPEYWPELRYRWQARHTGDVLAQERREPVVQERGRASPVCGVALCGTPSGRTALRAIATAVGVPGVVWPRPAADPRAGALLRELVEGLTAAQLPRAVYEERIRAGEGEGVGRHLGLLWDGPEGIPASLPLHDPQQ